MGYKTFFRLYWAGLISLVAAIIVLILIGYQGYLDLQSARYEHVFSLALNPENTIIAELYYPPNLTASAESQKTWPIIIELIDSRPETIRSLVRYQFVFSADDLLFLNANSEVIEPKVSLTAGSYRSKAVMYIQAFPSTNPPSQIDVSLTVFQDNMKIVMIDLPLAMPNRWSAWWQLLSTHLFEFSLVALFLGWLTTAIQQTNQNKKEFIQENQNEIRTIDALQLGLLGVIQRWSELKKRFNAWPELRVELENKRKELASAGKNQEEFFRLVGTGLMGNEIGPDELRTGAEFFETITDQEKHLDNMGDNLKHIAEIILSPQEQDIFIAVNEGMILWDVFDLDTRDLVVSVFARLSQHHDLADISRDEWEEKAFYTEHRRRLARDPKLLAIVPKLETLFTPKYRPLWLRH